MKWAQSCCFSLDSFKGLLPPDCQSLAPSLSFIPTCLLIKQPSPECHRTRAQALGTSLILSLCHQIVLQRDAEPNARSRLCEEQGAWKGSARGAPGPAGPPGEVLCPPDITFPHHSPPRRTQRVPSTARNDVNDVFLVLLPVSVASPFH